MTKMFENIKTISIWLLISSLFNTNMVFTEPHEIIYDDSSVPPTIRSPLRYGKRLSSDNTYHKEGQQNPKDSQLMCICTVRQSTANLFDDNSILAKDNINRKFCKICVSKKLCKLFNSNHQFVKLNE